MRPPVLCGGTAEFHYDWEVMQRGFNEAPGFMRGKLGPRLPSQDDKPASMRPRFYAGEIEICTSVEVGFLTLQ